jgi:hypothetical protein
MGLAKFGRFFSQTHLVTLSGCRPSNFLLICVVCFLLFATGRVGPTVARQFKIKKLLFLLQLFYLPWFCLRPAKSKKKSAEINLRLKKNRFRSAKGQVNQTTQTLLN